MKSVLRGNQAFLGYLGVQTLKFENIMVGVPRTYQI